MRALIFQKKFRFKTDYPTPVHRQGEALIRITHAGICDTDLAIIEGYMGFKGVPGHEFIGIVEKSPSAPEWEGERVTGEINIGCNRCEYCLSNLSNHCPNREVLGILNKDGAFAEYITLPIKNLHKIPDSISDEEGVFVEPLAAAFEILEQIKINHGDKICVLGDGKLGLLAAHVLSLRPAEITLAGHHPWKLALVSDKKIKTELAPLPYKKYFDVVVDCTGAASGIKEACELIKPRGKIIVKTTALKRDNIDYNNLVIDEISLIGSRCGPFDKAIDALKNKTIEVSPLISNVFPLKEWEQAFGLVQQGGCLKVILRI